MKASIANIVVVLAVVMMVNFNMAMGFQFGGDWRCPSGLGLAMRQRSIVQNPVFTEKCSNVTELFEEVVEECSEGGKSFNLTCVEEYVEENQDEFIEEAMQCALDGLCRIPAYQHLIEALSGCSGTIQEVMEAKLAQICRFSFFPIFKQQCETWKQRIDTICSTGVGEHICQLTFQEIAEYLKCD